MVEDELLNMGLAVDGDGHLTLYRQPGRTDWSVLLTTTELGEFAEFEFLSVTPVEDPDVRPAEKLLLAAFDRLTSGRDYEGTHGGLVDIAHQIDRDLGVGEGSTYAAIARRNLRRRGEPVGA